MKLCVLNLRLKSFLLSSRQGQESTLKPTVLQVNLLLFLTSSRKPSQINSPTYLIASFLSAISIYRLKPLLY